MVFFLPGLVNPFVLGVARRYLLGRVFRAVALPFVAGVAVLALFAVPVILFAPMLGRKAGRSVSPPAGSDASAA